MDNGYTVFIRILYRQQGSQVWRGNQGNYSWGFHVHKKFQMDAMQSEGVSLENWNLNRK